jgi:deoxyribodipyrimidine photolyase-related protein
MSAQKERGPTAPVERLLLVLGDQLNADASALAEADRARDVLWMAEVQEESRHVWSSRPRTALFLAAMRHFRDARRAEGWRVEYVALDDPGNSQTLAGELRRAVERLRPRRLVMTAAGDHRVAQALSSAAAGLGVPLEVREDRHFLCSTAEFTAHAAGRKQLRLEFFYRELRRRHRILLDDAGEPLGGQWNFDHDNRGPVTLLPTLSRGRCCASWPSAFPSIRATSRLSTGRSRPSMPGWR